MGVILSGFFFIIVCNAIRSLNSRVMYDWLGIQGFLLSLSIHLLGSKSRRMIFQDRGELLFHQVFRNRFAPFLDC